MKKTTVSTYRQRLLNVIDYIYEHIHADLDVNTLADVALMSPYHFHRIYRQLMNETVNATVRRLRLQKSTVDLIRTDQPIYVIAKGVAYGSVEAFTRAFAKQYGMSPQAYRDSKSPQHAEQSLVAMAPLEQHRYRDMFTVELMTLDEIHLAGYSHKGDYMQIEAVFEKLFIDANSHNVFNQSTRSIGVYYDDPETVARDELRSMAGITISPSEAASLKLEYLTIPAGKCASILFQGPYAELEKPYNWLYGHWLPDSGYEPVDFPCFEEYLNDSKNTPPNQLLTRIYCLLEPE